MSTVPSDDAAHDRSGLIAVNGVAHFYRMVGEGDPVVVLHGGPGMWHNELLPFFDTTSLVTTRLCSTTNEETAVP